MRTPVKLWLTALAMGLLALMMALPAMAWERYRDGCQDCHDFFTNPYVSPSGETFPGRLHRIHADESYMDTTCDLCHRSGEYDNPWLGWSEGTQNSPGIGCVGCHGQLSGDLARAYGLILRHEMFDEGVCTECHQNIPEPPTEDTPPAYYGTPDTAVAEPCNDDGGLTEDWSGDGWGLDNDGDGLIDREDEDCDPCDDLDGDGYGDPGDPECPEGAETDCDDTDPSINWGAAEACDGVDSDCRDDLEVTEVDSDGDGSAECDGDCDDAEPSAYPSATEICDDGIDNDCDGDVDGGDADCASGLTGDDGCTCRTGQTVTAEAGSFVALLALALGLYSRRRS